MTEYTTLLIDIDKWYNYTLPESHSRGLTTSISPHRVVDETYGILLNVIKKDALANLIRA